MNSSTSSIESPGAVPRPSANPIVWWVAGGLSLLGVGALAGALMNSPKDAAQPVPTAKPVVAKAATPAAAKQNNTVTCAHCGTVESVKAEMTVLGAVGGGLAGHEIEKHARATTVYHVQLRMDDGSTRTVTQSTAPTVGARVEVQGNELKPRPAKG